MLLDSFSFADQWQAGLTPTGLTNASTWGLYIVLFMFLVGIFAGGLIVVAGSELVDSHRFEPLARLAVIVSGTAVLGAVIDLWILTRPTTMPRALRRIAIITLPVAVLVHTVTAWIFGFLVARPFWNTAILAPLFISSALVSGTALVLVVTWVVHRTAAVRPPVGGAKRRDVRRADRRAEQRADGSERTTLSPGGLSRIALCPRGRAVPGSLLRRRSRPAQKLTTLSACSVQSASSSIVERCAPAANWSSLSPRASMQVPQQPIAPPLRPRPLIMRSRW